MRVTAVVVASAAALLFASCGGGDESPSKVTGVVVDVESSGLGQVSSFDLKDADRIYKVHIDMNIDYGFGLSHLNAHLAGAQPVTVELEERDGRLFALSIADAKVPGLGNT